MKLSRKIAQLLLTLFALWTLRGLTYPRSCLPANAQPPLAGLLSGGHGSDRGSNDTGQIGETEPADAADATARMPQFTWDHVPLYMHIRKATAYTDDEIRFLAKFPLITFEKANGHVQFGSTEKGTLAAAYAVKEINPHAKILYYRNVIVHYGGYEANRRLEQLSENPFLADRNGNTKLVRNRLAAYDLSKPAVRRWWLQALTSVTADPAIDGVFVDGNVKVLEPTYLASRITPEKKKALVEGYRDLLSQTRTALGPNKLMVGNLIRARLRDCGLAYLQYFDGSYIEGFFHNIGGISYEDYVAKGIEALQVAARQGKIIAFSTRVSLPAHAQPRATDREGRFLVTDPRAREGLTYPLAVFLICAGRYSYFLAHDGYSANEGKQWMRWFPEYDRPLGPPKGPASRHGYVYTRSFAHADVWVDIKKRRARIVWK